MEIDDVYSFTDEDVVDCLASINFEPALITMGAEELKRRYPHVSLAECKEALTDRLDNSQRLKRMKVTSPNSLAQRLLSLKLTPALPTSAVRASPLSNQRLAILRTQRSRVPSRTRISRPSQRFLSISPLASSTSFGMTSPTRKVRSPLSSSRYPLGSGSDSPTSFGRASQTLRTPYESDENFDWKWDTHHRRSND